MSESQEKRSRFSKLGEDWLAVIIGLFLVLLTWAGVISNVPWPLFGWFK